MRNHFQPSQNRLRRFLTWWKGELQSLVPVSLRSDDEDRDGRLLLLWGDDELQLQLHRRWRGHWQLLRRIPAGDRSALAEALLQAKTGRHPELLLRLPAQVGLKRPLHLPVAAEKELDQVVAHQLDTLSPLPAQRIYSAFRVSGRDPAAGTLQLEVYMAPREAVDQATGALAAWGITPHRIDFIDGPELGPSRFNLLPAGEAARPRRSRLGTMIRITVVLDLVLITALVGVRLGERIELKENLGARVETARLKAAAVTRLRRQLEQLEQENGFLARRKQQTPATLALLDELSRILPDDTWLETLQLGSGEMVLSGLSARAAPLIGILERSPLLEQAAFRSPLVQDPRYEAERFQIRTRIVVPGTSDE